MHKSLAEFPHRKDLHLPAGGQEQECLRWTQGSNPGLCMAGEFFTLWATSEAQAVSGALPCKRSDSVLTAALAPGHSHRPISQVRRQVPQDQFPLFPSILRLPAC